MTNMQARWAGSPDILPPNSDVEILATDPEGLNLRFGITNVPARIACWVRYWPAERDYPMYRSCDLADLELSDDNFARMFGNDVERMSG